MENEVRLIVLATVLFAAQPELTHTSLDNSTNLRTFILEKQLTEHQLVPNPAIEASKTRTLTRRSPYKPSGPKGIDPSKLNRHKLLFPETR